MCGPRRPHDRAMDTRSPHVGAAAVRRLAAEADVDPRTIRRRLRGEPVRGMAAERADRVLRARGIEPGSLQSQIAPDAVAP